MKLLRAGRDTAKRQQSGAALLLALFTLLLLTCIGAFLYLSSGTEARIATNYGSSLDAYYSAKSGIQEVRDRVSYPSKANPPLFPNPPAGGLADGLPTDVAGNPNGVLYILNPSPGETVDPTDLNSRYFDDQLCHDYNSGVAAGTKCNVLPGTASWQMASNNSLLPPGAAAALKWVRINMKTNRMVAPYCVDQACASLDVPVCWDGVVEQVSPGGALPSCDANGMQSVYMLTALAVTPGVSNNSARRLLRSEVVPPSIRPPGAVTMDAASASPTLGNGAIPGTAIDGRPHQIDGTLITTGARCSSVAAVGTNNPTATTLFSQALNSVRFSIVQAANSSCNWDGTNMNPNQCTPPLWWVRGNGSSPRFVTTITTTTTSNSGHDGDHSSNTTTTTSACTSSTANCYTNLDLGAQELYAIGASINTQGQLVVTLPPNPPAPFGGGPGNQPGMGSMYQASSATPTLTDEISALNALVQASAGQPNYFLVSSAALADSYGSVNNPVILKIPDTESSLLLSKNLTGFGVLVVPNDFEVNTGANLQWTGIVLVHGVNGSNAQFKLGGGTGVINGSLLLQPSTTNSTPTAALNVGGPGAGPGQGLPGFRISYSCDAIDMAFGALPFKVVASSEASF